MITSSLERAGITGYIISRLVRREGFVDCVTFPVPLITAFIATLDDTLTLGGGRAVKRDSET